LSQGSDAKGERCCEALLLLALGLDASARSHGGICPPPSYSALPRADSCSPQRTVHCPLLGPRAQAVRDMLVARRANALPSALRETNRRRQQPCVCARETHLCRRGCFPIRPSDRRLGLDSGVSRPLVDVASRQSNRLWTWVEHHGCHLLPLAATRCHSLGPSQKKSRANQCQHPNAYQRLAAALSSSSAPATIALDVWRLSPASCRLRSQPHALKSEPSQQYFLSKLIVTQSRHNSLCRSCRFRAST